MKDEVGIAVDFILRLIKSNTKARSVHLPASKLEELKTVLVRRICELYSSCWFPENPQRGQGFRCIRLNECDLSERVIEECAGAVGLSWEQLCLPCDLAIWVDPKDVCVRFGEHQGAFCSLATFKADGEVIVEDVDVIELQKKYREYKDKIFSEMGNRRNGRRGFLNGLTSGSGTSASSKQQSHNNNNSNNNNNSGINNSRSYQPHHNTHNNAHSHNHNHHHHHQQPQSHHQQQQQQPPLNGHPHHHGGMHSPPNGIHSNGMSWYNTLNSNGGSTLDMFSSSPPNGFGNGGNYSLAKFSPPKYGYGTASKWNTPAPNPGWSSPSPNNINNSSTNNKMNASSSPSNSSNGTDKYHWFNSTNSATAHKQQIKA